MAKSRPRIGRPRTMRLRPATPAPATAVPVEKSAPLPLHPSPDKRLTEPADDKGLAPATPNWKKAPDSPIRVKVMTILAMRVAGIEDEEIGRQLGIGLGTLRNYIYLAGRNGWLTAESIQNPVEQIEYTLLHKVVRNLDQYLDSNIPSERQGVTEKLFDATLAKHWAPVVATGLAQTLVAIRIETPPGPPQQIREGTIQGISAWTEGESV